MTGNNKERTNKSGSKEEWIKVEGDWEDAAKKAVKKKRPEKDGPKPEKKRPADRRICSVCKG